MCPFDDQIPDTSGDVTSAVAPAPTSRAEELLRIVSVPSLCAVIELAWYGQRVQAPTLGDWIVAEFTRKIARRAGQPAKQFNEPMSVIPPDQASAAIYVIGAISAFAVGGVGRNLPDPLTLECLLLAVRDAIAAGRPTAVTVH